MPSPRTPELAGSAGGSLQRAAAVFPTFGVKAKASGVAPPPPPWPRPWPRPSRDRRGRAPAAEHVGSSAPSPAASFRAWAAGGAREAPLLGLRAPGETARRKSLPLLAEPAPLRPPRAAPRLAPPPRGAGRTGPRAGRKGRRCAFDCKQVEREMESGRCPGSPVQGCAGFRGGSALHTEGCAHLVFLVLRW